MHHNPEFKRIFEKLWPWQEDFFVESNYQLKMQLPTQRTSSHEFPGLLIKMSLKAANNCGNWHQFLEGSVKIILPETGLS